MNNKYIILYFNSSFFLIFGNISVKAVYKSDQVIIDSTSNWLDIRNS